MSVYVVSPAQLRVSTGTVAPAQIRAYPIGYGLAQFDVSGMMSLMMSLMQMVLMLVFVLLPIQLLPKILESIKV